MARMDRKSWAIAMVVGGLAFNIALLLSYDYISGVGRVVAIASLVVLVPVWIGATIHFLIAFIRHALNHGVRRHDA